jgi:hypothetical protein
MELAAFWPQISSVSDKTRRAWGTQIFGHAAAGQPRYSLQPNATPLGVLGSLFDGDEAANEALIGSQVQEADR